MNIKNNLFNALKSNWLLLLILLTLGLWTKYHNIKGYDGVFEEFGFLEIISSLSLIYLIYLNIKFRNLLSGISSKILVNLRTLLFIIVLWEENSLVTKGQLENLTKFNRTDELNFHNLNFLSEYLIKDLTIPFTDISFNINFYHFFYLSLFLVIGIGSFIPLFKKFRILFLEKQYSFYCLIYPLNVILNKLSGPSEFFIHDELFELFFYILLSLDTLQKVKSIRDSKQASQ
tara:strand:+ start:230 stop:922 length:693 start_codon:yes stop_codon:yes gene_type:complete